jgi:hypothetical protein
MAGPARDDGGVKLYAATAVGALLAGVVLTGCGSGSPSGASPGGAGAAGTVPPSGSASSPGPGSTVANGSPSPSKAADGTASPAPGGGASGPGCAAWPAGSTRTTLLITQTSNDQRYCVRTGQTVQVSSAGTLSLTAGSKPPHLTGTALAPARAQPGQAVRSPAATYAAVRPGVATLTVVRLPCRSAQTPASPASGMAGEMAYTSRNGGAPVGAQCQLVQALQVTIVVR